MKKLFTLIAAALLTVGASAQTDFGTLSVCGNKVISGGEKDWDNTYEGADMTNNGDGTYTFTRENVTLEAGTAYEYKIISNHAWSKPNWGDPTKLKSDGTPDNAKAQVAETAVYTITITITPDAEMTAVPNFTAIKTGEAQEITHTYTVVGATELTGANWDQTKADNDMALCTDDADDNFGLYVLTINNLTLETGKNYEYKVALDHAWGTSYPSANAIVTVPETAVYSVTYTFDPTSKAVNATATKTGEAGEITHTYVVAGQTEFTGENWNGSSTVTVMALNADGKYEYTLKNVTVSADATTYEFKIVENGSTWIGPDGNNATITFDKAGTYDVTITFDATTQEITATATAAGVSDGINSIAAGKTANGATYNLAGQRVGKSFKGIVIRNGRKYIQ